LQPVSETTKEKPLQATAKNKKNEAGGKKNRENKIASNYYVMSNTFSDIFFQKKIKKIRAC